MSRLSSFTFDLAQKDSEGLIFLTLSKTISSTGFNQMEDDRKEVQTIFISVLRLFSCLFVCFPRYFVLNYEIEDLLALLCFCRESNMGLYT